MKISLTYLAATISIALRSDGAEVRLTNTRRTSFDVADRDLKNASLSMQPLTGNSEIATKKKTKTGGSRKSKGGKNESFDGTLYKADFGQYGSFELSVSNDGFMSYETNLMKIGDLSTEIGIDIPANGLGFHLHTKWSDDAATIGIGGPPCVPPKTGLHYDPFAGCGIASAYRIGMDRESEVCGLLNKGANRTTLIYNCNEESFKECHANCEVGDLSGKYGGIMIDADGYGYQYIPHDPFPALNCHHTDTIKGEDDPLKFASIVFHGISVGRPLPIICGQLVKQE